MKIEKLIDVFEKLLPIYEKAYKRNHKLSKLEDLNLSLGLCWASLTYNVEYLGNVFCYKKGYYKNCLPIILNGEPTYLFPKPKTAKDLKPRIDFMKSEIKSLKRLQKKGYTDI
jgi:hypothetical protein